VQQYRVQYAYLDARRAAQARTPPLKILGPKKAFDSSLSMMGGLFLQKQG
jgi:hypothetical protein